MNGPAARSVVQLRAVWSIGLGLIKSRPNRGAGWVHNKAIFLLSLVLRQVGQCGGGSVGRCPGDPNQL